MKDILLCTECGKTLKWIADEDGLYVEDGKYIEEIGDYICYECMTKNIENKEN